MIYMSDSTKKVLIIYDYLENGKGGTEFFLDHKLQGGEKYNCKYFEYVKQ